MRVLLTVVLAVALWPGAAYAQGPVPEPDDDPFYAVPAGLAPVANGAVLAAREIQPLAPLPVPAQAWQVKYKTLGAHDEPTATVATVLVPDAPWTGRGTRPLVSYQVPEDGVGTRCAPSYALRAGPFGSYQNDIAVTLPALLAQGWAVVTSDYEGPRSLFASAAMTAHGVLDGIRAARRFGPAAVDPTAPVALVGYSGGGFATTVAAQFQHEYAPELRLAGAAAGGAPADIRGVYDSANASPYGGALWVLFIGLNRTYPAERLEDGFTEAGRRQMAASSSDCLADAAARHPLLDFSTVASPEIITRFRALQWRNSPLQLPGLPRIPMQYFHAQTDELVPFAPLPRLIARFCAAGVAVDTRFEPVGEHIEAGGRWLAAAVGYVRDRFAGRPAPSSCAPCPRTHGGRAVRRSRVRCAARRTP